LNGGSASGDIERIHKACSLIERRQRVWRHRTDSRGVFIDSMIERVLLDNTEYGGADGRLAKVL
jgi:hypothetical protein